MKDGHEDVAHRADILDIDDEAVCRSLDNAQSVGGPARKIIDLFEVMVVAFRKNRGSPAK
jgi:hypothetical protein